jgi:inosine/xanthosine triphosphatase
MTKVIVGSTNPVKIAAVKEAFSHYFQDLAVEGMSAASGVSDQPIDDETYLGAQNRAEELLTKVEADYYVGVEGGVISLYDRWFIFGAMCVLDRKGRKSFGSSPHFELPPHFLERIQQRHELGALIDELTGETNLKQKGGAAGLFTHGRIDRSEFYVSGLVMALVPFINESIYFE